MNSQARAYHPSKHRPLGACAGEQGSGPSAVVVSACHVSVSLGDCVLTVVAELGLGQVLRAHSVSPFPAGSGQSDQLALTLVFR